MDLRKLGLMLLVPGTLTAVACSDATAPRELQRGRFVETDASSDRGSSGSGSAVQITIDPSRTSAFEFSRGVTLRFPRASLCDPARSSYGPTEWDKPCTLASAPITFTVTVSDDHGHPRVDFDPSVRFAPSVDANDWVILSFSDHDASEDPLSNILYCATPASPCYDESLTDPSLIISRDRDNGRVKRRIKHFSGYLVAAGIEHEVSLNRKPRSGYILASGRDTSSY